MGDLFMIYPKPYSIYLRGTIGFRVYKVSKRELSCNLLQPPHTLEIDAGPAAGCEFLLLHPRH